MTAKYRGGMEQETTTAATDDTGSEHSDGTDDELLIEEISIDGMCGVY